MKRGLLLLTGLAVFVGLLVAGWKFAAGNAAPVDIDLVWTQFRGVLLWRMVLLAVGVGAIAASLVVGFAWLQGRLLNRRYRATILRLEAEIHQLRSLPLAGHDPVPIEPTETATDRPLAATAGRG